MSDNKAAKRSLSTERNYMRHNRVAYSYYNASMWVYKITGGRFSFKLICAVELAERWKRIGRKLKKK